MSKRKTPKLIEENPEWTAADFKTATLLPGTSLAKAVAELRKGRGPQKAPKKVAISIRLHPDIVRHFKRGGAGWQSRMESVLMKASGAKKAG
jgi:uncharacterized protein (DUF4415 family)